MKTNLSIVHDETFWAFRSWAEFSMMTDKREKVVIIPVVGFSDWNMEAPLDFEEVLAMSLLRQCMETIEKNQRFLVIPPQRFNLGRRQGSFFTLDPETAHASLEEVVESIHGHGFRKVLFLNSSPWNEDFVDSGGRDLRIKLGVQPFCINLSGLGLNFLSVEDRPRLHALRDYFFIGSGKGSEILLNAARDLATLLDEVHALPPLRDNGRIPKKEYSE